MKVQFLLSVCFCFFLPGLLIVEGWSWTEKSYFGNFQICGQCLYYRICHTVLHRKINFNFWPFFSCFLLVNMSWMSYCFRHLNYAKYFKHVQKIKHWLCLKPFSVLIYGKFNSIFYIFGFCLVFKLYKSSLQIPQFISGHLIFFGSVDIDGYLIVTLFERWILTLAHFSDVFFPDL